MRRHVLVISLLLTAVSLAGCADSAPESGDPDPDSGGTPDEPVDETPDEPDEPAGPDEPDEPDEPAPAANRAPGASLSASMQEGIAPQEIRFDMDGSDADGDRLSWSLDVDGDGSMEATGSVLPANYTHSYVAAGDYVAKLRVSDGTATTVRSVDVNLSAAPPIPVAKQAVSVSWAPGNAGCAAPFSQWVFDSPAAGLTHGEFAVNNSTIGHVYTANLKADSGAVVVVGMDFYNATGHRLVGGGQIVGPEGNVTGVVPVGATHVLAYDCLSTAGVVEYRTLGLPV